MKEKIRAADYRQTALLMAQKTLRSQFQESNQMLEAVKKASEEREEAWRKRECVWKKREEGWREKEQVWGNMRQREQKWKEEEGEWKERQGAWEKREEGLKGELIEARKLHECQRIESALLTESVKTLRVQLSEVEKLVDIQKRERGGGGGEGRGGE